MQMITNVKVYLDVVKVLFFKVKNIGLYLFYYFKLRVRVSIIPYITVTNYHTVIEEHKRFQNNNIILHINSI